MPLIVEDGTGKSDAQSYASVADADSYLGGRGYTVWAPVTNLEKEACLIRATDFMLSFVWKGLRKTNTQALDWPRVEVVAFGLDVESTVVPLPIKQACIELAFRAAYGPLATDIIPDDTGRLPYKEVKKVGPIDVEKTWTSRGQMAPPSQPVYTHVLRMLAEYLGTSGRGVYR